MVSKIKTSSIIVFIFILLTMPGIYAQNNIVSKFERVADKDIFAPTLKISFHSWGEGKTEKLSLDQYFPVKRNPNSRYAYLAPPEISVSIDQTSGIASLTAFKDWTGTKEIIFALTDVYSLETTLSNLQKYRDLITQQRAPVRLKQEFEDLPSYQMFEKILDDLESKASQSQSTKIEVSKVDNNIRVSVGKDTVLDLNLETLTEENLPTLKPTIGINIQQEEMQEEMQEEGLSFFIFIPLILIAVTLLILGVFYLKNNKERIKKHFKKEKQKPTVYSKLIEQKRELSSISSRIDQQPIKESENAAFNVIKNFFNAITPEEYQFSYSEIKKDQIEKELSDALKEKLCKFSREIADIRFSGKEAGMAGLKNIIRETQQLINLASSEEKSISEKRDREKLKKSPSIKFVKYILDSFGPSRKVSAEKIREKINIKKKLASIPYRLGIIKTLAERELERKKRYLQKFSKIKEKERKKEDERRRKEDERRRKELLKIKGKQEKEHLKWLNAQRKIRESQKKQEEKRKRRLERAKVIRDFFHKKFGLFKTVKDIEKELEEKRKKQLEKERIKRSKRRLVKKSILDFLHFLRIYKTQEEKHEEGLILKREERLRRQHKERIRETRKQAILSFLHKLKLYRTREEVEREKERRLRKLHEKQREKEEGYKRKELEEQRKRRLKQNEKLRKLEEKKRKQHLKALEKAREERESELARKKRKEYLNNKKAKAKKYLHDYLGLFKTIEEKEREREARYREKLKKEKEKEEKRLQKLKKKQEENLRKQRLKEKETAAKEEAEKKKHQLKLKQEELRKKKREEKKESIRERKEAVKKSIKKFLSKRFGLYKTKEELEREKKKLKEKTEKEFCEKNRKESLATERRKKLRQFLHDKLGLFKTREEIEKSKLERKERRIELEHKLEDTVLKSIASRFERKKLTPEQEIKILMQMEQEEIKKGNTEKSKEIQNKINKLYKQVRRHESDHPLLIMNRIRNSIESARDHIFSSTSKLDSLSPFIKKLNHAIRSSVAPKIENSKIDQINYLVSKAEVELRRNRKEDAKEYYKRAIYLYRSMNQASQKAALPALMKIKNEITSAAIVNSLERAFSAIYTGQVKRAEKLYKDIDVNFLNLPTSEREKIYEKKEELYQKINEQKESELTVRYAIKPETSIIKSIKNIFKKKKNQKFYPVTENKFRQANQQEKIKEEKVKQEIYRKKESLAEFILARKPSFTSIKTEIESKKHHESLAKKLFSHISSAEKHLQRNDHEKAHENYRHAIEIFKDAHLKPGVRDNAYRNLNILKEKIIHTSIYSFMKKAKESMKKEEIEQAKKFHSSLEGVYNHLQRKKEKEIAAKIQEQKIIPDLLFLERKLDGAFSALKKGNKNEALSIYHQVNNHYNNLTPQEKKRLYPRLITLYSELLKK